MRNSLTPGEVDLYFKYPSGRTARLARVGRIASIKLPDGEIRIDQATIEKLLSNAAQAERMVANAK
ncbi:MAG: hypothetical protein NTU53_15830 [Planctomycetota bacterium]|nr:hypothetical protein [Planctomycetota bacterium]